MSDRMPRAPVPGFTDLRRRIQAGETLFGSFVILGSPIAAEGLPRRRDHGPVVGQFHDPGRDVS
jgi:hypothetical protein